MKPLESRGAGVVVHSHCWIQVPKFRILLLTCKLYFIKNPPPPNPSFRDCKICWWECSLQKSVVSMPTLSSMNILSVHVTAPKKKKGETLKSILIFPFLPLLLAVDRQQESTSSSCPSNFINPNLINLPEDSTKRNKNEPPSVASYGWQHNYNFVSELTRMSEMRDAWCFNRETFVSL